MKLWDLATGQLLRTFEGHSGFVPSVAFSPDGVRVLSGSADGTMKLYKLETGDLVATLVGAGDGEWVALTPEGFFDDLRNGNKLFDVFWERSSFHWMTSKTNCIDPT